MIIWINGAFGVGKTTCAYELNKRLPDSFVYDPENIGYFINKNFPQNMRKSNFQNYRKWRLFNYEILKYLSEAYSGIILVPMTLVNPQYYDEIIGRLLRKDIEVMHLILYADKETICKRLHKRLEWGNSWAKSQIERCIYCYDHDITEIKIITDGKSVDDVVKEIAQKASLPLSCDKRNNFRKWLDRSIISIKHIR